MAGCDLTDKAKALLRSMARARIKEGMTDPHEIVTSVHDAVKEFAPIHRSDVADTIAGHGGVKKADANSLSAKMAALRSELRDLEKTQQTFSGKLDTESSKDAARRTALKNQIADLNRRIDYGDTGTQPRGKKYRVNDEATQKLIDERDAKQKELNNLKPAPPPKGPLNDPKIRARESSLRTEIKKIEDQINGAEMKKRGNPVTSTEIERLKKELESRKSELAKIRPSDPMFAKNKARQSAIKSQLSELQRRIDNKDFSKSEPRQKPAYSQETQDAEVHLAMKRREWKDMLQRYEDENKPAFKKALGLIHDLHIADIFTSLMVYPKLAAAVLGGHVHALLSGATISAAKMVPQIRKIAELSPDYGAGLTMEGLKARYGSLARVAADTAKGIATLTAKGPALETLKHGASHLEMAYGDTSKLTDAYMYHMGTLAEALKNAEIEGKNKFLAGGRIVLSYPGRAHGLVKQFLSTPAFFESKANQAIQIKRAMESAGKTPEEIEAFLNLQTTRSTMNIRAMDRAYEEKMQGKNKWNDAILTTIGRLDASDNPGANLAAFIFKTIMPVVRVGPNVFKQGTSLMFGGIKAALEAKSGGAMTPERADYIMKNIGAQGSGLMIAAIGAVFSGQFGGIPGAEAKKRGAPEPEVKPEEASLGGIPVGAWGFHGAPMAMLQLGSGLVRVYEQELKLNHDDALNAALFSLGSNVKNWAIRTLPYTDQARRIENTLEYGRKKGKEGSPWGEVLGNQLRSMFVPSILQQEAAREDTYKGYRRPRNIKEDLKLGIPKLREEVPR